MYGTKGRIGLLVPSVNTVVEPEFNAAIPEGYSIHATRMRNESANVEDSIAMLAHVERAADELGSAHVDVAVFACTASSFVEGTRGEAELRDSIARIAAAPVVTTSDAVREALRSIGARRISMVTPYPSELNALEVDFLNAAGISVLAEVGMGVVEAYSIAEVDTERTVRAALDSIAPESDALFLSCTNLRTFEIVEDLEKRAGVPVITSNSAALWLTLRTLGHSEGVPHLGRLLAAPVPA